MTVRTVSISVDGVHLDSVAVDHPWRLPPPAAASSAPEKIDDDRLDARRSDVDADEHVAAGAGRPVTVRPLDRFGCVGCRRLGDDRRDATVERQRPGGVGDDEGVAAW